MLSVISLSSNSNSTEVAAAVATRGQAAAAAGRSPARPARYPWSPSPYVIGGWWVSSSIIFLTISVGYWLAQWNLCLFLPNIYLHAKNASINWQYLQKLFFSSIIVLGSHSIWCKLAWYVLKSIHYKASAFWIFVPRKSNTFVEIIQNITGMARILTHNQEIKSRSY